ncbi:MAG: NAD-dependent epimerase/dehydratase family protein, partial [Hyphomicrobiales bacterium]|nr:NAD-dependent epimerase/dehydratase family protein [Hyphomicrobiales bacterium]
PESAAGVQFVNGSILDPAVVNEALDDVDEVYHLAGLPGMWVPDKNDFHAVNCRGTEIVLAAARKRGVARFLHCSTESILFGPSNREPTVTENVRTTLDEMPGAYTRSKMQAEQLALAAAASGFPVVIANPTMPIGPHRNLTPPTAMLRYFLERRFQFYVDFVLNLVDVRDVAAGLLLVMERGQIGQRYILGGENITLGKLLGLVSALSGRNALRIPLPAGFARIAGAAMDLVADRVTHRAPSATVEGVRIALHSRPLSNEKSRRELGYAPRSIEPALRDIVGSTVGSRQSFGAAASYKSEF